MLESYFKIKEARKSIISPVDIIGCYSIPKSIVSEEDKKFYVLVSLMISSQTKDEVNCESMLNLMYFDDPVPSILNKIRFKNIFLDGCKNKMILTVNDKSLEITKINDKIVTHSLYLDSNNLLVEVYDNYENVRRFIEENALKNVKSNDSFVKRILNASPSHINRCIQSVGFHNKKAVLIKELAKHIYSFGFPSSLSECLKIKGFGKKMSFLYLNKFYSVQGVSVDTHVHRISNRIGLVKSKTPEETTLKISKFFTEKEAYEANSVMVGYGQIICISKKPKCSICEVKCLYSKCKEW